MSHLNVKRWPVEFTHTSNFTADNQLISPAVLIRVLCCFEQLYSSPSVRGKQTKTVYNKHQNTIDMPDYQAVTRV